MKLMLKVEPDEPEDVLAQAEAERTLQDRIHILETHFNMKVKTYVHFRWCFYVPSD